ncbi:YncE family protein [Actinokineospora globicatena]|uniref:Lipoprotein n=1 Tax=Actinokineospora globicatena TaxID=103729 RepID=A0A9W6QGZ1_9PSEU|nr:hypothetical protein [Actinokineospora globicatena]MCP2303236.1 hypothetical protein [Actinokineospora globicatena]GLW79638.1 lipoprotein [Actinokineospora globicatena]GLW85952.1 lipoprotein [Actinokineospora globicatena]GLW90248.1 lipoprotein [Actinokineospora globicatena]
MTRAIVLVTATALCAAFTAGCSSGDQPRDELMVTDNPVAATPAQSPAQSATPAGTVLPLSAPVTAVATDATTRVLAVASGAELRLYDLDAPDKSPRALTLPGPADSLTLAGNGGAVLATIPGRVVRVALPDGTLDESAVDGLPTATATFGNDTLVAVRDRKQIAVLGDGQVRRVISGSLLSADQVFSTGPRALVLDRLRNAVFQLDVAQGTLGQGLRAGQGSTNGVVDRWGRVLVTDTRGGALLAFSLDPLLMRQRYPVAGSPYGIAYDAKRDLAWVTLTETNELVGYQVGGEEPVERHRYPTVSQPNSVAVDPETGRVVVASANGGGVQVVRP